MAETDGGGPVTTVTGRLMSIGGVLAVLREEFPEVTISKIRFLEAEGLVEPQRTPSGYRKFTAADVARLAQVLRMQRDHYLPLRVIREQLDAPGTPPAPFPARETAGQDSPDEGRLSRGELLREAGVGDGELADWEAYGLIAPDADGGYDPEAAAVARLLADLGRYGFEPRHLKGTKAAAEREAGLIEQAIAPLRRHRSPRTRADAETAAQELIGLASRLHSVLLRSALRARKG
ncbi:putative HTH-type transcriptional regulator [Streptomyces sp. RB5]|uniref:Putative HTH-type transcriptional regulator n=1 Tax=Streptomyces smaragdinus TaxID=2585196 RepID=A0A7K0CSW0_9ACTN|nr:MerR family transcriptional regulator [Streptomyces smaragdinus]MQY16102.1 putative HTH-type transcriptional regulator [Streptomyces smaragdinus]